VSKANLSNLSPIRKEQQMTIKTCVILILLVFSFYPLSYAGPIVQNAIIAPIAPDDIEISNDELIAKYNELSQNIRSATGTGRVYVVNRSSCYVNVYGDGKLIWRRLPPNYFVYIYNIPVGWHTGKAKGCGRVWGPIKIKVRAGSTFTWVLY
jgi:hypothetical protein